MVFNIINIEAAEVIATANERASMAASESEKLSLKLNDLSARYDAIILAKSNLEKKYAQSEEQSLVYKKALLNSQIDNGKLVDESDNQNFDLKNKVMALQKETMEASLKMDTLYAENSEMKTDLTQMKHERNSLTLELESIRSNYTRLDQEHKSTLRKMDELGIEIVNLVNTKETLLAEKRESARDFQKLQKQYQPYPY